MRMCTFSAEGERVMDKYADIRLEFKDGDWVFGIGEHIGCSMAFDFDTKMPQPFSYLDATNPDDFRVATAEEIRTAREGEKMMERYTEDENYGMLISDAGAFVLYEGVKQLESTNNAQADEIDALKAHVERLSQYIDSSLLFNGLMTEGVSRKALEIGRRLINETPSQSLSTIKADAIREMIENTQYQDPAMRVVQDMLDYTDNLEAK